MQQFDFGRVQVSSLVGIDNSAEPSVDLYKGFETFGGTLRPVIVVKGEFNPALMDNEYRVVGNHDVAKAAQMMRTIDSRQFEMVNAMIVDGEIAHLVHKFN